MSFSQNREEVLVVLAVMAESCEHDHHREFAPESLRRPLASFPQKGCCYSPEEVCVWGGGLLPVLPSTDSELTCFGFVWAVDLA